MLAWQICVYALAADLDLAFEVLMEKGSQIR